MFFGWMVHVNSIKFSFHIVLEAPIGILVMSDNIFLWFIYPPGFNIVNYLRINIVGVPSFNVGFGTDMGYVTYYPVNCCKDRSFVFSNSDKGFGSERVLAFLVSVLVHSFSTNILLYF